MKPDLAVRLTATEDEDEVKVAQVRRIVASFVENLVVCSMCDGEKIFTFQAATTLTLKGRYDNSTPTDATVPAGAEADCPACAGTGRDPAFSSWHCYRLETQQLCESSRSIGSEETKAQHKRCGLRAMLPLDEHGRLADWSGWAG